MHINELIKRYPVLETCQDDIRNALSCLLETFEGGNKLLLCGNGGSASDCEHISGELLKGFLLERRIPDKKRAELMKANPLLKTEFFDMLQGGLPAISLVNSTSFMTAFINDVDADFIFAQQVYALGKSGDLLLVISTSGMAKNVLNACKIAGGMGIKTLALTGRKGGSLTELCDISIRVPEDETYKVQELHLPVYHALCAQIEADLFSE